MGTIFWVQKGREKKERAEKWQAKEIMGKRWRAKSKRKRDLPTPDSFICFGPEWAHRVRTQNIIYVKGKYAAKYCEKVPFPCIGAVGIRTLYYNIVQHIDVHFSPHFLVYLFLPFPSPSSQKSQLYNLMEMTVRKNCVFCPLFELKTVVQPLSNIFSSIASVKRVPSFCTLFVKMHLPSPI